MWNNLILVPCLEDNNIYYHFENRKCIMKFSNVFVGLAMKQEKFYLLFNCDPMNEIKASSSMNACDVNFKHKQNKNQS